MKDKKEKVFKGMTAPVDVHLDIPEEEIWTYKIDGLANPHINKPFTNFTVKKIVFTVLLLIAVGLSMYFSVRVVSRTPFEYDEVGDGTYEFVKFNNTGYIKHLDIDYAVEIVTDKENPDAATNFTLQKDESKPISSIPQFCFNCDETVETIYIGKDVREIDGKAFFTCRMLKQIIVDEENEYFCDIDGVLYNKDKTRIILYPMNHPQYLREKYGYNDTIWADGENNMEFRARYEADILTYVLPDTVETIGELAFYDLPLAVLYMPEGLKRIETMAIMRNWWMTDIYSYESSEAEDGEVGFSAVSKLSGVYRSLPDGLEYIGSDAMSYCDDGAVLRIPASVKYIGHHAFFDTAEKKDGGFLGYDKVYMAMSEEEFENVETGSQWIPEYDSGLLDKKVELVFNAEKIYEQPVTLTEKEDGTYELTAVTNRENAAELRIDTADDGKAITSIAHHPFEWDDKIETVYIGKSVNSLYGEAFVNLRALKSFVVDEENESFTAVDGVLYTKDMKTLLCCPKAYEGGAEFTVPEKVEIIGRSAFSDCKFEKIYLPEGLRRIESMAFLKAESLKEIISYKGEETYASLPEGLEFIGLDGFNYASGLTYLYIPASVKEIGAYSFCYCAKTDENGNKTGITEVDVALSEAEFKKITAGDHWVPEFRNAENEIAGVNYSAERK
ncbi:MAG: leucine-rich repeat protein [Clostridia bacterium]|nr:leucine-rich repeat protein [Clostridia bacterium]